MEIMTKALASISVVLVSLTVASLSNRSCVTRWDSQRHSLLNDEVTELLQTNAKASLASERSGGRRLPSKLATDVGNRQKLSNYGDAQYILTMNIAGEDGISGIPDTGSFELVVFPDTCTTCGKAAKFNLRKSKTYKDGTVRENFKYGSGNLDCKLSSDVISMGPLPRKRQGAWFVEKAKMSLLYNAAFNAIVGIGPPETPSVEAWTTCNKSKRELALKGDDAPSSLVEDAKEDCNIAKEIDAHPAMVVNYDISKFSICLGSEIGSDGSLIWYDDSVDKFPDRFTHVPITGKSEWSTTLTDVTLRYPHRIEKMSINAGDEKKVQCHDSSCIGLLDSGTSLLALPRDMMDKLQGDMKALDSECSNYHVMPTLTFKLAGKPFTLKPESYIGKINGKGPAALAGRHLGSKCQLMIMDSDGEDEDAPLWIFGMPFFREYYTTFKTGMSAKERSLYIARADKDCNPADPSVALVDSGAVEPKKELRTVEGSLILSRTVLGGLRSKLSDKRAQPEKEEDIREAEEGEKHQVVTTVLQSQR